MSDIQLRFNHDEIVLAPPLQKVLEEMGMAHDDLFLALLTEPDTIEEAYRRCLSTGAVAMVTPTGSLSPARLAHVRMESQAQALADAAFTPLVRLHPQHILVEINPCDLPFDASSQASIKEHERQYHQMAALFEGKSFDGFLLCGFKRMGTLRPAIDALKSQFDLPIFVSVVPGEDPNLDDGFSNPSQVALLLESAGVAVLGFEGLDAIEPTLAFAEVLRAATRLPLLVTLSDAVGENFQGEPSLREHSLDRLMADAEILRSAGVQFLRMRGSLLATAAMAGAVGGMPVILPKSPLSEVDEPTSTAEDLADLLTASLAGEKRGTADGQTAAERAIHEGSSEEKRDPSKALSEDLIERLSHRVAQAIDDAPRWNS